jgi:cobalt/nickel transport system permease protein
VHISEGVLSPGLLLAGAVLAAVGTAVGLRRLDSERLIRAGLLTAVFYLASLVHVPVGPASAHLVLNGVMGLLLGWASFPAILVGLLLHSLLFQFGGLTVLGVNTVIMAGPAVLSFLVFAPFARRTGVLTPVVAFLCGAMAVGAGALLLGLFLALNGEPFFAAALVAVTAHLPVMAIEGLITMSVITFLQKIKPELLNPGRSVTWS